MNFLCLCSAALGLDFLLGDPHRAWHPVVLFGKCAALAERFCRKFFGNGILSGLMGWSALSLGTAFCAWGAVSLAGNGFAGALLSAFLIYITIALRSLLEHSGKIRIPLANGDLPAARRALSMIVSRETENLEESEIVRGGIESVGENIVDAVASALFWAWLGWCADGFAGAAAGAVFLRAVNTLDALWGYKNDRYLKFGRIAARADDAAHFIPARLTLLAISAAALLTGNHPWNALKTGIRHRHDHPSPNSGYGMAGFAGALNVRLGGPTRYRDGLENYPYWGDGKIKLTPRDLLRSEILAFFTGIAFLLLLAGLNYLKRKCF